MGDFTRLHGALYVGPQPDPDTFENNDPPDNVYSYARFESDAIDLAFNTSLAGYYTVNDTHFMETDGCTVYFPAMNETVVEPAFGVDSDQDLSLYADDVCLEYACIDGAVYVRSQLEITAYAPVYLVVDGDVYEVVDPLLTPSDGRSEPDAFLALDTVIEEPVLVRNVTTGYAAPVTHDRVSELVGNDEANGALRVSVPSNIAAKIADSL